MTSPLPSQLKAMLEYSLNFYKKLIKQILSYEHWDLTIQSLCKLLCIKIVFNAKFDIFREKSIM